MVEGKIHNPTVSSDILPAEYSQRVAATRSFVRRFIGGAIVFFVFLLAIGVWEANIKLYVTALVTETEALVSKKLDNFTMRFKSFDSRLAKLERENRELISIVRSLHRSHSSVRRFDGKPTVKNPANVHPIEPVRTASIASNPTIHPVNVLSTPPVKAALQKSVTKSELSFIDSAVALLRDKGQTSTVAEYGSVTLAYIGPEVVIAMAASKKGIADENFNGAIIESRVAGDKVYYKVWKSAFE